MKLSRATRLTVRSGDNFVVVDPAYVSVPIATSNSWAVIPNLQAGGWRVQVVKGTRGPNRGLILALNAYHDKEPAKGDWADTNFSIGVDSGMAGIFFLDYWNDLRAGRRHQESWLRAAIDRTTRGRGWGRVTGGVVSATTFGDGVYPVYVRFNEGGMVSAVSVEFAGPEA